MTAQESSGRKPLLLVLVVVAAIAIWFALPFGRHATMGFFGAMRMDKPQAVNVNLSQFVGPDANHNLQQMVTQMVSDKVKETVEHPPAPAGNAAEASQSAGFAVKLIQARTDAPALMVVGAKTIQLNVDRARLQAIFQEAGRPDLVVPQSVDGQMVTVKMPAVVIARYGHCPGESSAAANIATPEAPTTGFADCLILREGGTPSIDAPAAINMQQLAEIGLELAGMPTSQAQSFMKTAGVKALLGTSFSRNMRSYQEVPVDGVTGTLLSLGGHGPSYALIWTKNGISYSLTGYGDSTQATKLAGSMD